VNSHGYVNVVDADGVEERSFVEDWEPVSGALSSEGRFLSGRCVRYTGQMM